MTTLLNPTVEMAFWYRDKIRIFTAAQAEFILDDTATERGYADADARGKTLTGVMKVMRRTLYIPGSIALCADVTDGAIKYCMLNTLLSFVPSDFIAHHNKTSQEVKLVNGSTLLFRSYGYDGSGLDVLRGLSADTVWMDNTELGGARTWDILRLRARRTPTAQAFYTGAVDWLPWQQRRQAIAS